MGKQILKGLVIAFSGDFGAHKSAEDCKRWVTFAGGKYAPVVNDTVTHLVCTPYDWKTHTPFVEAARNISSIFIVSFDWLEDSLSKRIRLKEKSYQMEVLYATKKKTRRAAKEKTRGRIAATFKDTSAYQPSEPVQTRASTSNGTTINATKAAAITATKTIAKVIGVTGKKGTKAAKKTSDANTGSSHAPLTPLDIFKAHELELQNKAYADKPRVEPYTLFGPTNDGPSSSAADTGQEIMNGDMSMDNAPIGISSIETEVVLYSCHDGDLTETLTRHGNSSNDKEKLKLCGHSKPTRQSSQTTQLPSQTPKKKRIEEWQPVDPEHYHLYKEISTLSPIPSDLTSSSAPAPAAPDPRPSSPATVAGPSSSPFADTSSSTAAEASSSSSPANPSAAETVEAGEVKTFEYNITLVRIDIRSNTNERFNMRLFESHKIPYEYAAFLRFSAPDKKPVIKELAPQGSTFDDVMEAFENIFYRFTRKKWADRDAPNKPVSVEVSADGVEESIEENDIPGLPSLQDVKARPFTYVKPGRFPRQNGFGLGPNAVVMPFGMGKFAL